MSDAPLYIFTAVSPRARRAIERSGGAVMASTRRGVPVVLPECCDWYTGAVRLGARPRVEDAEFTAGSRSVAFTWPTAGGGAALAADPGRRLWHWRDAQCPVAP